MANKWSLVLVFGVTLTTHADLDYIINTLDSISYSS